MVRAAFTLVLGLLALVGCSSTPMAPPAVVAGATHPLVGTSWLVQDIDRRAVMDRVQSTLSFDGDENVSGQAGCNRYFGAVDLDAGSLAITRVGSTRMACAPAVMDQERRFLDALQSATAWERDGDLLLILGAEGRQRLRMSRIHPASGAVSDPPVAVEARQRGAAFHALGHAPSWNLEILPDRIEVVTASGSERVSVPMPAASTGAAGETVYAAQTEAHRLTVRIRSTACVDARSGLSFPATVEVQLDATAYRGCGQWLR